MTQLEFIKKAIPLLRKLSVGEGIIEKSYGLCYHLECVGGWYPFGELIEGIFEQWEEYSGDEDFPVPHKTLSCAAAFYRCSEKMYEGEYGEARKRLAGFTADKLKEIEKEYEICKKG